MNNRIKIIRKSLNLTQQEFADKLGTKRTTIANYENRQSNPSEAAITLICKEFNININWLRTGDGEMFNELSRNEEIAQWIGKCLKDESKDTQRKLLMILCKLPDAYWDLFANFAEKLAEGFKKNDGN